jgi:hypothetical protein
MSITKMTIEILPCDPERLRDAAEIIHGYDLPISDLMFEIADEIEKQRVNSRQRDAYSVAGTSPRRNADELTKASQLDAYKTNGLSPPRIGGLKLIDRGGRYEPTILCDVCGQPVIGGSGMAVWTGGLLEHRQLALKRTELDGQEAYVEEPYFVHKGACDRSLGPRGLGLPYSWCLPLVLVRVLNNAGVDYGETMERFHRWAGLL